MCEQRQVCAAAVPQDDMHTRVVAEAAPGASVGGADLPLFILSDELHAPTEDHGMSLPRLPSPQPGA